MTEPPSPSNKRQAVRVTGALPSHVSAVGAQRLLIATTSLPSPFINLIKRTAAFDNPEFYKKQAMRMSTARTPRVSSCADARHGNYGDDPRDRHGGIYARGQPCAHSAVISRHRPAGSPSTAGT
ncbi:MAG: UvsW helicase [Myxococcales bacterium]|nr:UvsW helicase [Myxococcales bacterium]